jgi:hypothetical protein
MAADCKSALLRVRWFESSPLHQSAPLRAARNAAGSAARNAVRECGTEYLQQCSSGGHPCGCSSMVELKPSKLMTRVRFPSPAPVFPDVPKSGVVRQSRPFSSVVEHSLGKGEATCSIHVKGTRIRRKRQRRESGAGAFYRLLFVCRVRAGWFALQDRRAGTGRRCAMRQPGFPGARLRLRPESG